MDEDGIKINGKLLKDLKVSELKEACKDRNIQHTGTKATLVKRLHAVRVFSCLFHAMLSEV